MTQPHPSPSNPLRDTITRVSDVVHASLDLVANVLDNVNQLIADVRADSLEVARESEELYRSTALRIAQIRAAIRATPRFGRIVAEGLRVLASYRVHAAKARLLSEPGAAAELSMLHRANAARIRDLCLELRGGVLKLGQFASCRMDLLPPEWVEALSALQDRVPPIDLERVTARIEEELGALIDELYARFDPEPIAAASLAQVHAAELLDGTRVAVKVQVPGVEEILEIDLAAMRVLAAAFGETFPGVDVASVTRALARSVREEIDFASEAANAVEMASNTAGDPAVVIPQVFPRLSSRRVLTLGHIEGRRLTEFLDECLARGEAGRADLTRVFGILLDSFCAQVLDHGLFHADPHPGNFLVCLGPRLAVLDFGCVQRFEPELRAGYARLAAAALGRNHVEVAALLTQLGFRTEDGRPDGLVEMAQQLLEVFQPGGDLSSIDPREQLARALELARRYPIAEVPQHFVLLGRVFGALGGLLLHYRPQLDLFGIIAPHLSRALARALAR